MNLLAAIALHEAAGHSKTPVCNKVLRKLIRTAENAAMVCRCRARTKGVRGKRPAQGPRLSGHGAGRVQVAPKVQAHESADGGRRAFAAQRRGCGDRLRAFLVAGAALPADPGALGWGGRADAVAAGSCYSVGRSQLCDSDMQPS